MKLNIIVSNMALLKSIDPFLMGKLRKELTVEEHVASSVLERSPFLSPPQHKLYRISGNDSLQVPVGFLYYLGHKFGVDFDFDDQRFESADLLDIEFGGKLRSYQEKAVDALYKRTVGLIQSPVGSGKTAMLIALICKRKQPTLFICNRKSLCLQFLDEVRKFTNYTDLGLICDNKCEVRNISAATFQTLNNFFPKQFEELNHKYGQVLVDEVHTIAATTYYQVLNSLKAKYKYGVSATIYRDDGLEKIISYTGGPIAHEITLDDVKDFILIPIYKTVKTNYFFPIIDTIRDYGPLVEALVTDRERNDLIKSTWEDYSERNCLFLCSRVNHVEILNSLIPGSVALTGKTPQKTRIEIFQKVRDQEIKALITTDSLFKLGMNFPVLDVLFLCSPSRSRSGMVQAAGRIMRKKDGKAQPIIVDFVDHKVGLLYSQSVSRKRSLRGMVFC